MNTLNLITYTPSTNKVQIITSPIQDDHYNTILNFYIKDNPSNSDYYINTIKPIIKDIIHENTILMAALPGTIEPNTTKAIEDFFNKAII